MVPRTRDAPPYQGALNPGCTSPLTHLGEPLEPPPLAPARGPPTDWAELVQAHDDRDVVQASPDELTVIDIHAI
jgi:hypothetical protein